MDINREIYFMKDRFIEDEIESAIKKYLCYKEILIKKYLCYKEILIMEFNQCQEIWLYRYGIEQHQRKYDYEN